MDKQHRYLPTTKEDRKEMLETIGVSSIKDLFSDIPESTRATKEKTVELEEALSEQALTRYMKGLADVNITTDTHAYFIGAGTYDHYIPSVVNHVLLRSEFMTAYTPYQPEASQGELQALFEFQTMMCELTGMDVANSSLYDGFTSLGEACNLATSATKRNEVVYSGAIHPQAKEVVGTYAYGMEYDVKEAGLDGTYTDMDALKELVSEQTAAVIIQYPNFYGTIEDLKAVKELCDATKTLLIVMANPLALALIESPGKLGADIVVGDTQPLGLPMNFGGPHCGYFAVKKKFMRKVPSRIVGQTTDEDGKRGFVMTLQTREQHIRREKATSNMSSNQALTALASSVFLSTVGKVGLQEMAQQNISHAHYVKNQLKAKGMEILSDDAFFNEFVVKCNEPIEEVSKKLLEQSIVSGYDVSDYLGTENALLLCVTEKRTKEEMDTLVDVLTGEGK
ncbi:glycine dehydrogenase subunit 1 [Alkalibacterium putridalgicola]|uniref:Probable glycine dehydrogenase (decarboxylating) subunit 1 n=1 Tax=Alkalibacterium putridalgicola TaxID=426703 RepID=A0A1H7XHL2_9LACT|nr:aminomethyl-transferring glycine dehydrogenase subunit GcvPA [Alkalibacterium putridalgicola]GEK90289.1 putative glycine dehydrogenase (decarboxylating) subunit 1 [Alkalibacterium putridalgicola]SEM33155.1 glycine dehydrogenase subunit 1 [Alkalibacterium putridalgicola]